MARPLLFPVTHMCRLPFGLAVYLLALTGCTPGTLGSATGTGGTTGTGGSTGGTTGTGGASPGTTTLRITIPATQSFCDENPSCTTTQHLWILNASGQALTLGAVGCTPDCSTCTALPCPELPIVACPAGNFGVAVTSYDYTWDGSYIQSGSCTSGDLSLNCADAMFATPGRYDARFCATPGTLSVPDGGIQTCTAIGPQECTDVGFDFPAAQPVMITLQPIVAG